MKIGIFVGSLRHNAMGVQVGQWVMDNVADIPGVEAALLSLRDFNVPLLDVDYMPAQREGKYPDEEVQRFADAVAGCEGFIFVTPEYNRGVPGPMKNAVDHLMVEWLNKPVGFVGYGSQGARVAVEAWRPTVHNFKMRDVETALELNIFGEDVEDGSLLPRQEKVGELRELVESLLSEDA